MGNKILPAFCRLDKSVNLLTIKRALLALLGLWHRKPWQQEAWLSRALRSILSSSCSSQEAAPLISADVRRFYDSLDGDGPRQHGGIFEGSALSGVILTADEAFDWSSLPAEAGTLNAT